MEAHSPTKLQFRPFLAFRNANDLCVQNGAINTATNPVKNGISTCLYAGYPNLFMQFSKQPEWVADGHWYNGVEYYKDRDRGIPYKEDLWVPGYFEAPHQQGESIIFSASTFEADPDTFIETYENEPDEQDMPHKFLQLSEKFRKAVLSEKQERDVYHGRVSLV